VHGRQDIGGNGILSSRYPSADELAWLLMSILIVC